MMTVQKVTGELDVKVLASGLKRLKQDLTFTRWTDGRMFIQTQYIMLCVSSHYLHYKEFGPWKFPEEWEQAIFTEGKGTAQQGYNVLYPKKLWKNFEKVKDLHMLTVTHVLWESHGAETHKTGQLYRRLNAARWRTHLDKAFTDLLSPEGNKLEEFLFEQLKSDRGTIRVSAHNGHVAYLMPALIHKDNEPDEEEGPAQPLHTATLARESTEVCPVCEDPVCVCGRFYAN